MADCGGILTRERAIVGPAAERAIEALIPCTVRGRARACNTNA
jgi:hypothetical protein